MRRSPSGEEPDIEPLTREEAHRILTAAQTSATVPAGRSRSRPASGSPKRSGFAGSTWTWTRARSRSAGNSGAVATGTAAPTQPPAPLAGTASPARPAAPPTATATTTLPDAPNAATPALRSSIQARKTASITPGNARSAPVAAGTSPAAKESRPDRERQPSSSPCLPAHHPAPGTPRPADRRTAGRRIGLAGLGPGLLHPCRVAGQLP